MEWGLSYWKNNCLYDFFKVKKSLQINLTHLIIYTTHMQAFPFSTVACMQDYFHENLDLPMSTNKRKNYQSK